MAGCLAVVLIGGSTLCVIIVGNSKHTAGLFTFECTNNSRHSCGVYVPMAEDEPVI